MEYNRSARHIDEEAKRRYDEADRVAKAFCGSLAKAWDGEPLGFDEVAGYVRDITFTKYGLSPTDATSEYFNALGEISIAKSLGKSIDEIKGRDLEAKCNGASSVMTKKYLLVIFLNRELGISIDLEAAVDAITIPQMAELVYDALVTKTAA